MSIQYFNLMYAAATTQNIGCLSIMTPPKITKQKISGYSPDICLERVFLIATLSFCLEWTFPSKHGHDPKK